MSDADLAARLRATSLPGYPGADELLDEAADRIEALSAYANGEAFSSSVSRSLFAEVRRAGLDVRDRGIVALVSELVDGYLAMESAAGCVGEHVGAGMIQIREEVARRWLGRPNRAGDSPAEMFDAISKAMPEPVRPLAAGDTVNGIATGDLVSALSRDVLIKFVDSDGCYGRVADEGQDPKSWKASDGYRLVRVGEDRPAPFPEEP